MSIKGENRIFIIGLDGACFDVINPLIESGVLPNIQRIFARSAKAELKSTIPPVSAPAWVAIATGQKADKTGAYDFLNLRKNRSGKYYFVPVSSANFIGKSLWDLLSLSDKKVCVFNYPMLYPPYEINGVMVSGLGTSEKENITFPDSLKEEIFRIAHDYRVAIPFNSSKYLNNEKLFIKELFNLIEQRQKVLKYLLEKENWDLFFVVFSAIEIAQHYLWKHWDDNHRGHKPESETYKNEFIEVWRRLDAILGELLNFVKDNDYLFIISDHGHGPQQGLFYVNSWLEKENFLKMKRSTLGKLISFVIKAVKLADKRLGLQLTVSIEHKFRRIALNRDFLGKIDLDETVAFAGKYSDVAAGIHILPHQNPREREIILQRIISRLQNFCQRLSLDLDLHCNEKPNNGAQEGYLPDLVFSINNYSCRMDTTIARRKCVYYPDYYPPNKSGTHRQYGIMCAMGPDIDIDSTFNAEVFDIAPTVLSLFNYSVPDQMDGKVLPLFKGQSAAQQTQRPANRVAYGIGKDIELDQQHRRAVEKRLKELGYL